MSMMTKIVTEIKDLDALKKVLSTLKYDVEENGEVGRGASKIKVDLKIKGRNIGFNKNKDGVYEAISFDNDNIAHKVIQEYAAIKTYEGVRRKYTIKKSQKKFLPNGNLRLEIII